MTKQNPETKVQIIDERSLLLQTDTNSNSNSDTIHHHHHHGFDKFSGSSYTSSVFNLSCTIIGAGIMSLPATFKVLGVLPGLLFTILAAFFTESSVELLLRFSKPGSSFSYGHVMGDAFGFFGKFALQFIIVINNLGVLIIYLIIIEDVLSGSTSNGLHHAGVLEGWFGQHWWTARAFVLLFLTLLVFLPLICLKRIDSLRHTSAISVALAIVFLVIVTGITMYKLIEGTIETPRLLPSVTDWASFWNLFTAFPVVICAYVCHYNVHTIEEELTKSSQMQMVVRASLGLCAVVYGIIGLFGFLLFGESTLPDLLANFDTDIGVPYGYLLNDILRVSYAIHIILIFPIVFHPLRLNLDGLIFASSSTPLSMDNLRFGLMSFGLIIIVLLGAILIPNIWVVFQFVGATAGILIAFIFPASITLRDYHGIAGRGGDKILPVMMIMVAVIANAVAIYSNFCSLFT